MPTAAPLSRKPTRFGGIEARGLRAKEDRATGAPAGLPPYLQRRLATVSRPFDATEREADHAAERLTSPAPCPACAAQGPCAKCGAAAPTAAGIPGLSSGEPLDGATRAFFEPRFGAELGAVRVHASDQDGTLARQLSSRAFTTRGDIVFGRGQYAPGTDRGRTLLAHELAHVVQPGSDQRIARQVDGGLTDATVPPTDAGPHDAAPEPLPGGVRPPVPQPLDSVYGTCLTPEESARRDAFAVRAFHLERNIPSTTFGLFDTDWFPLTGTMPVTVKIKFEFVEADNAPGFFEALMRRMAGENVDRFFWSPAEQANFKRDYVSRVSARWSGQHTMHSIKPCWGFDATPQIWPTEVDSSAAAHYVVTVHKSPGPGLDYKSGTNDPDVAHPERPATANLYSSDVQEEPNFNSVAVARSERQRLETAVASSSASPIQFDKDSDVLSATAISRLTAFANACKAKNPSDPLIPIVLDGFASMEGETSHNMDLSRRRAARVREFLASLGVLQPLGVTGRGPVGAPEDASNRRVDLSIDHAFETGYASNRYSVAEHEFGHMLGLPDEYQNNTTGTLGTQQTLYSGLVTAAGVAGPAVWGADTASQMADGVDVLPRHYVTLWEALGRMTAPDIAQADWSLR